MTALPPPPDDRDAPTSGTATNGDKPALPPRVWPLLSYSELKNLPPPQWIIDGHLTDGFAVLYGPSGSMKTFVALDWALSIATGRRWHTHDTRRTPVVYVSGEGTSGIYQRCAAWQHARKQQAPPDLYVIPYGANLLDASHADALAADVHATQAGLLVIDTLARSMVGGDENSAQDMGVAVATLDRIRHEQNCAVLVVHHTGVEQSRPRGSTALFGATDTVIKCTRDAQLVELYCDKQKDAPPFPQRRFVPREHGSSIALEQSSYIPATEGAAL